MSDTTQHDLDQIKVAKSTPLQRTQELFDFLQGKVPDGTLIKPKSHVPKLTAHQAWSVVWYLGNQYWQVTDHIERCGVCGSLYETWSEGGCLDFGKPPYHFCENCMSGEAYEKKSNSKLNPNRE